MHYETLNVSPDADQGQIRSAYLRAAKAAHPDSGGTAERFHAVQEAWEVLGNPTRRKAFDAGHTTPAPPPVTATPPRKPPSSAPAQEHQWRRGRGQQLGRRPAASKVRVLSAIVLLTGALAAVPIFRLGTPGAILAALYLSALTTALVLRSQQGPVGEGTYRVLVTPAWLLAAALVAGTLLMVVPSFPGDTTAMALWASVQTSFAASVTALGTLGVRERKR